MTGCPLLFYVPYNDQVNISLDKMDQNLKKGIKILEAISKYLKIIGKEKVISEMDRLLYIPFNNNNNLFEILLNEIIELTCSLNRFPIDDGFGNYSTKEDINKKNILDGFYGHKYLDSRHMLTILLGSQQNPNYRDKLREELKDLIKETYNTGTIIEKLQIFTRLKIALYEGLKLNKECQTEIKTVISNLQKKGIIEEKEEVDAEAEQRAKEEAEQRAKEEAEQRAKEEAEQRVKAKKEAEQRARAKAKKEEAEQRAKAKEAEQRKKIKALVNSNHTNKTCKVVSSFENLGNNYKIILYTYKDGNIELVSENNDKNVVANYYFKCD